jgi:YVTN family beta-propeller protein
MRSKNLLFLALLFLVILSTTLYLGKDSVLAAERLYVVNSGAASVSVIDTLTNQIIDDIRVGKWPAGITVYPEKKRIYVMNSSPESNSVSVIDPEMNSIVGTIKTGIGPMHMAIDPETDLAYVTDTDDKEHRTITIVDLSDNTVKGKITFERIEPFESVIVHNKRLVYVAVSGGYYVSVFSLKDNTKVARIPVGKIPLGLAYSPASKKVYVTSHDDNNISIIDTRTNKVVGTVQVGKNPWYIAVDAAADRIYVTCAGDDSVSIVETIDHAVIDKIKVGSSPRGIAIDHAAVRAYVANKLGDSVSVIDLINNTVIGTIKLEQNSHPWGVGLL